MYRRVRDTRMCFLQRIWDTWEDIRRPIDKLNGTALCNMIIKERVNLISKRLMKLPCQHVTYMVLKPKADQ